MTDYVLLGQYYHLICNLGIGFGMLSAALAVAISVRKKQRQHIALVEILLCGLLIAAGISRIVRALGVEAPVELAADAVASIFALGLGFFIWPHLKDSLSGPAYEQMEEANRLLAQANERLHQQQRLFDAFMDHSPAVSFLEDENNRLIFVNKAFEQQMQVRRDEVLGKPSYFRAMPADADTIREQHRQVLLQNKPVARILPVAKQTGAQPEPWLTVRFPVPGDSGNTIVGGIAVNLASEYEKQASDSKLAAIVESSQDAIIGKDLDGNITNWNRGAEQLYGYTPDEIIGKNMSILFPEDRMNELAEWLDKVRRGVAVQDYKTTRISKQGDAKDISESISPIRDGTGNIVGAAVIARDITMLKKQQKEIGELNQQLKKRITDLAEYNADLQTARDQALEASNLKSAFVANISHEIRTPLSGILGLNELLLQNGNLNGDDLDIARMVQQSAEALLVVVNDILDLSKIEAGKITLEYAPFNPIFLLQDCTRLMAPTAHQKGLNYELLMDQKIPDMLYGDVSRLRQVLLNIIGNAIKFTEKGTVQVSAHVTQIDPSSATIEFKVRDTGIGISPEQQRFLFLPFVQADNSSTRKFGGTGLGLTISKRFVEMMSGKILVESEANVGSTFTLCIQLDRKKLNEAQEFEAGKILRPVVEPVPASLSSGRKILVVEDNPVLQDLAIRQLVTLGLKAETTIRGRDAIELATTGNFDLVLMDINLPDINGLQATAAIRNKENISGRPPIPIIAMTAGAMKGDRERALASGMDDYLAKPVAIEELKRVVELWLAKIKLSRRTSQSEIPRDNDR